MTGFLPLVDVLKGVDRVVAECTSTLRDSMGRASLRSRKVLLLFSGAYSSPDGLAVFLERDGLEAECVDYKVENGGEAITTSSTTHSSRACWHAFPPIIISPSLLLPHAVPTMYHASSQQPKGGHHSGSYTLSHSGVS